MPEEIEKGTLYIVATPIGNLDDISYRAVKILSGVDAIAAEDTRKTRVLLNHLNLHKELISYYSYNEQKRTPYLIGRLKDGESIGLVSDAGTPGISDPAYRIVREAITNGIPVRAIPGAAAFLSALIVSGLPTDRFVFEGFLPSKKGRLTRLKKLAGEERTIIFYESPHRLLKALQEILEHFGDREMSVSRELTKKFEEVIRGRVSEVLRSLSSRNLKGEFVIVVAGEQG
jgi:16S rRNA (cytidine1402-2'-O)-methyltransferase